MAGADEILTLELSPEDFERLGVLEEDDCLYLPTEVRRRGKDGQNKIDRVLLTEPTNRQRFQARIDARAYAQDRELHEEKDRDYFEQIENVALLTYALRDYQTKGQLEPNVEALLDRFPDSTLTELWVQLNKWIEMLDPRYGRLSKEELWTAIAGLARGNLDPLARMPTYAQSTCFALMAREACSSPNAPSFARLPGTSDSDSSTPTESTPASAPDSSSDEQGE